MNNNIYPSYVFIPLKQVFYYAVVSQYTCNTDLLTQLFFSPSFLCDNVKNYFRTLTIKVFFASFRAREIGCNNAATPDMFGHYRQAKFTMIKHHWWWKVRRLHSS